MIVLAVELAFAKVPEWTYWENWPQTLNAFNERVQQAVANFNPFSVHSGFSQRLSDSEYGWRPLSWAAPFNITAARWAAEQALRKELGLPRGAFVPSPEVSDALEEVLRSGPRPREQDPQREQRRLQREEYRRRSLEIRRRLDSARFPWFVPTIATKIVGMPDAYMNMVRVMLSQGAAGWLVGGVVLVVTVALAGGYAFLPWVWLPVFVVLAWLVFLPVRLGAFVLDGITQTVNVQLPATDTLMLMSGAIFPPVHWSLHHLAKHYLTEALLRRVPE